MPVKSWGSKFLWYRLSSGSVRVLNPRTNVEAYFPNIGHALRAAQAAKGRNVQYKTL